MALIFSKQDRDFQADLERRDPQFYMMVSNLISGYTYDEVAEKQGMTIKELHAFISEPSRALDVKRVSEWFWNNSGRNKIRAAGLLNATSLQYEVARYIANASGQVP